MKTKICSTCKQKKILGNFYKSENYKDGLSYRCKECERKRGLQNYKNNIEKRRQYKKEYYRKNKDKEKIYALKRLKEHQELVDKIKLEKGCKVCGYKEHPSALEFHHRNPSKKEFNVGQHILRSKEKVLNEIEKCDVYCANHHNILHSGRG